MKKKEQQFKKGEVVIYRSPGGPEIRVKLENDTVWLDAHLIAKAFNVNRPAVVKHINNILKSGELEKESTCSILEQVAADGKIRKMNLYNLDMIISVGYRVNSKQATQFRIWATKTLKEHLVKGYTVNEYRLLKTSERFKELQETIELLKSKAGYELLSGQEGELLSLLALYSKTLTLLEAYDQEKLTLAKHGKGRFVLDYDSARKAIDMVKHELMAKKEASDLFGRENGDKFKSIIGSLYQTYGGKELYPSLEEKAAHLLYFTIKDHPFVDGNKRSGAFLFVYFLDRNKYLFKKSGERKINDNALTALALLIAVSDPKEKDKMVRIVTNLLK